MVPGKRYTPEDLLRMVWQRKWFLVIPLVIFGAAAIGWAQTQPSLYKSETVIQVVPQRVPQNYVRSTVTGTLAERLQSINQQILSRTRLESLIRDFQLYQDQLRTRFMEDVVDSMRRDIVVQVVKGDTFRVSYTSSDPRRAMQVTERLASLFIEESLKDREVLADGTNQFLETQLQEARARLIEHEKKLEAYNRAHRGELPNQLTSNLQAMNGMQMRFQALADSLNRDRDRKLTLDRMLADLGEQQAQASSASAAAAAGAAAAVSDVNVPKAQPTATTQQLDAARRSLQELELRLQPAHPDIARARRAVEELEKKAETEAASSELGRATGAPTARTAPGIADSPNSPARRVQAIRDEMDGLDRQIATKETEQARLKDQIAAYESRVEATPTRESELVELTRDYGTLQSTYASLLSKSEEAKISANLERRQIGEQFKVLDPARIPQKPFSPDRPRIALLGAFLGLLLGTAFAGLLEYRDTTLKTDDDVLSALALPVLALVPVMQSAIEVKQRRRRTVVLSLTSMATVLLAAVAMFFVWKLRF